MLNDLVRLSLVCLYVSKLSIWGSCEKSRDSRARDKRHECPSRLRRSLPRVSRGSLRSPARPLARSPARPLAMIEELARRLVFHLKISTERERQFKMNGRQSVSVGTKYERKVYMYCLLISHRYIQIEWFPPYPITALLEQCFPAKKVLRFFFKVA